MWEFPYELRLKCAANIIEIENQFVGVIASEKGTHTLTCVKCLPTTTKSI